MTLAATAELVFAGGVEVYEVDEFVVVEDRDGGVVARDGYGVAPARCLPMLILALHPMSITPLRRTLTLLSSIGAASGVWVSIWRLGDHSVLPSGARDIAGRGQRPWLSGPLTPTD